MLLIWNAMVIEMQSKIFVMLALLSDYIDMIFLPGLLRKYFVYCVLNWKSLVFKHPPMKKIFIFIFCLSLLVSAYAQSDQSQPKSKSDQTEFKTVFGPGKNKTKVPLGYFFEINAAYTMLGSNSVFLPGISVGVILNHHWTIGLSGSVLGNPNGLRYDSIYTDTVGQPKKGACLNGIYGGLLLEYTLLPNSVVHVSFPLMIDMGYFFFRNPGKYNHSSNSNWEGDRNNHTIADTYCFIIEPGIRAEFNLVRMFRMGITISYRYSPNFSIQGVSQYELNQFNAKLSFRLGKF